MMLTLVGVGHVFDISPAIEKILEDRRPRIVALELDRMRLMALESNAGGGGKGMYGLLARYQERLAETYGTTPGAEMLAAANKAREMGAGVALIDMDASLLWKKLWKNMRFREKAYLFFGSFAGIFVRGKKMDEEIERLQREPESFMEELGRKLPTAKTILIDERNTHMANNINQLLDKYGSVVAFVGDGHIHGMAPLIKGEKEIIRLIHLVENNIPEPDSGGQRTPPKGSMQDDGASASFSFVSSP